LLPLARNGYTEEEVKAMLHAEQGSRQLSFRYELFDRDGNFLTHVPTIESGSIDFGSFRTIKRQAKFTVQDFTYGEGKYFTWSMLGAKKWSEL
jgi:hypothetical protein